MFKGKFYTMFFVIMLLVPLAISGCGDDDEEDRLRQDLSNANTAAADAEAKRIQDIADGVVTHDGTHDYDHDVLHVAVVAAQAELDTAEFDAEVAAGDLIDAKNVTTAADKAVEDAKQALLDGPIEDAAALNLVVAQAEVVQTQAVLAEAVAQSTSDLAVLAVTAAENKLAAAKLALNN